MPKASDYGIVSVLDVVTNQFSIEGRERGDEFDFVCVNPDHDDSSPSSSINLETGFWNCFSCGVGGDIIELGRYVTGEDSEHVTRLLVPDGEEALRVRLAHRLRALDPQGGGGVTPVVAPGPYESGPLTYLRHRGFQQATLERWGIRWVPEETLPGKQREFTIENSIAIPIRDSQGNLTCWCYRRTDSSPSWQPKYLYSFGVEVSELWFGVHMHATKRQVTIVEGGLDAVWLDQAGVPALGMLGAKMGEAKIRWLQRFTDGVYLFGDRDTAGREWVYRVGEMLHTRIPVRVVRYPKWLPARDPQECSATDIEIMMASALPYQIWVQQAS